MSITVLDNKYENCAKSCTTNPVPENQESRAVNVEPSGQVNLDSLIDAHWDWIKGLLDTMEWSSENYNFEEYIYKTAFKHGWKHCQEHFGETQTSSFDLPIKINL